ncbi:hypothetical protein Tco_1283942 [Tanacetum coccineum]
MKDTSYELIKDEQKKQLVKNNEAKMTLYNALPRKVCERVFMCKTANEVWHTLIITYQCNSQVKNYKINLLTHEYEKFSISNEETIDSGFTRFNDIVTSLKSLDSDYCSNRYCIKGQKQGKTDKTEHGNGISAKNQSRRQVEAIKGYDDGFMNQGLRLVDEDASEVEFFEGWKPLSPLQLAVEEVISE